MSIDKTVAKELTKTAVKKSKTFLEDCGALIKNHPYKTIGITALTVWLLCKAKPSDNDDEE